MQGLSTRLLLSGWILDRANSYTNTMPTGNIQSNWKVGFLLNCIPCTAGFFCPQSGQVNATEICYEGYYCPNGTIAGHQFPCPPGTFGDRPGLTLPHECLICPQGKICGWGTGINNNNTYTDCLPGTTVQQVSCYVSMNFRFISHREFHKFLLTSGLCDCADILLFYSVFCSPVELKLRVTPSRMFSS